MQTQVPHFLPQVVPWVPHVSPLLRDVGIPAPILPPASPKDFLIRHRHNPINHHPRFHTTPLFFPLAKEDPLLKNFDSNSTYLRFSRQAPPAPPLAPKAKGRAVSRRRIFKDLNLNQIVISSEARNLLFARRLVLPRPQIQSPHRT
jgi:hypothetical protein